MPDSREMWTVDTLESKEDAESDSSGDSAPAPRAQRGFALRALLSGGRLAEHLWHERSVRCATFRSRSERPLSASTSTVRHGVTPSAMINPAGMEVSSSSSPSTPNSALMPAFLPRKAW